MPCRWARQSFRVYNTWVRLGIARHERELGVYEVLFRAIEQSAKMNRTQKEEAHQRLRLIKNARALIASDKTYDYLRFYIDGVEQPGSISGEVDWVQQSYNLSEGTHTLRWEYTKDAGLSGGSDAGWLDNVRFTPAADVVMGKLEKGRVMIAPNVLDLSKPGASVKFHMKGDPFGQVELSIYDAAGQYMGKKSVTLNAGGTGVVSYNRDGVDGYLPAPGAYWILARGGGVNDKKLFFAVSERGK